jgi:hypothetical protein
MSRTLNYLALGALGALAAGAAVSAEPKPAPCASAEHHQFDFWIGAWDVTEAGKAAGHNDIQSILGGCALLENWTGAEGGVGKSLNYFDAAEGLWHQQWVDGSGSSLSLAGKFEGGSMRLEGTRAATARRAAMRNRITWTPMPGGKVRQLWESSPADKDSWTVQFDGIYSRAPAAH